MKKTIFFAGIIALVALTGAACNRRMANQGDNNSSTDGTPNGAPAVGTPGSLPSASLNFDCILANCTKLTVSGDPESTLPNGQIAPFHGYADPSMRKDPTSNRIWMAYSWPHVSTVNDKRIHGVESHLAYSDDSGKTWKFDKVLWPEEAATNLGGGNEAGYMSHEVPNLLPVQGTDGITWYGVRMDYFTPSENSKNTLQATSFRMRISKASTIEGLTTAPSATLGAMATAPGWKPTVNLAGLSPELSKCQIWNEAALYYEKNTLYFSTRCLKFNGKIPDTANSDIEVFSTSAQGDPASWQWKYVGALTNSSIARELGASGLTQIELAKSVNGQLMAIMTPDDYSTQYNDYVHHGCVAVEMTSINPPTLARDSSGKLKILATLTASDQGAVGPAACTYDAASATGILMTRRTKNSTEFSASLNITGIKP